MRTTKTPTRTYRLRGVSLAICTLCAVPLTSLVNAQDDDEEIFTLSPFEVTADQNEGYRATSTLAGSRINTDLKDVAASVTVVTEAFMDDIGAVDLNDILIYTGNTESTGNYTAAGENGTADNIANNPQGQNRIRGLGGADLTRDYFRSIGNDLGPDGYNIERVTINRGPNSILFGLGNPSGVINYKTKTAYISGDGNEVSFRYGSYDDVRATFDVNRVLVEDRLAVRVLGLWSDRGFKQQPSHFEDSRLNFALTFTPHENTTIKLNYERVDQNQNNPNSITPIDHVSEWVGQGRPSWDAANADYDAAPDYVTRVQSATQVAFTNYDGTPDYFINGGNNRYWTSVFQQRGEADLYTNIAFSDNNVAPMHSMNLNPNISDRKLDTISADWSQKILDNLYLNVGYMKETLDRDGLSFTRGFEIFVDNNTTLPDGRSNPHFGETYMPQRTLDSKSDGHNENRILRATATYELDLEGKYDNKFLGRHNFTALAERQKTNFISNVYNEIREDVPSYLDASNRADSEDWQITRVRYLGGTADSPATVAPVIPKLAPDGVPYTYFNNDTGTWDSDTYNSMFTLKRNDWGDRIVRSKGFIWQSYWWEGKVVGTAGWREDSSDEGQGTNNVIDPGTGLVKLDGELNRPDAVSGSTSTVGVVVHPLDWLHVHYNESENFTPAASDVNMYGDILAPPAGTGTDFGFAVDMLEGKMNMRFNWYEVEESNSRLGWGGAQRLAQWELLFMDENVMPEISAILGVPYERVSQLAVGEGRIRTTANAVAEGMEIEMTYNPTENWRFMANASKQKAVSSGIGQAVTRFLEEALPYWEGLGGGTVWNSAETYATWGFEGNPAEFYANFPGTSAVTYNAAEGRSNPQIREWRFNAITNYTFTDGKFKGWNMGGALRWQDESAIGFPTITEIIDGNREIVGLELDNPYTDPSTTDVDLWVGFDKMIMSDKVKMNIQLNLQNVTRSQGFQAINKNSDGQASGFRIEFGPTWTLQSTFSF